MPSIPSTPECPLCGEKLECFHQKRQDVFAVLHGRGNGRNFSIVPCKARFTEFSRGTTEALAWEATEQRIREYQEKLSQQPKPQQLEQ